MTDSSAQDVTNEALSNYTSAQEAEALAELWNLLAQQTQAQPQQLLENHSTAEAKAPVEAPKQQQMTDSEEEAIAQLRKLFLGEELQARLDSVGLRVEDLSRLLPEALMLRTMQDEQLPKAIQPSVEQAIQISVKQDLNVLSEALFPIMGPATRKAVSTALKTLTESLNQALDHSLSLQSFKWRLEARRTGKSFAEVVLLRTLVYRVEQVFLIHRQTALVLHHVVATAVAAQDADLVSAMLKAIQDFVQDSFKVSQDDALNTLEFGELTIWIEQGPQAILAGVIRGKVPQELRLVFQTTIENIHKKFFSALNSFQGDPAPFEPTKQYLEDCLQVKYQVKKDKPSPILLILLCAIFCSLGIWGFFSFQQRQRWVSFLEKLNSQPGIVVVRAEKHLGKYYISGLRDPLAVEPTILMQAAKLNPQAVISRWEPYISLNSSFTTTRIKRLLQPPATVLLSVDNSNVLHLKGTAPRQWISQAKKLVNNFPGITQIRTDNLIESELIELQKSKEKIESQILYFVKGDTKLVPGENGKLQIVFQEIKKLTDTAPAFNQKVQVEIIGHSDSDGLAKNNLSLSQARANAILSNLVSQGVKVTNLTARGVGTQELPTESMQINKELNLRVSFNVILTAPKRKLSEP